MNEKVPVKHVTITPEIQQYVVGSGLVQDDVLRWIVERTQELGRPAIQQIVPEEGALLTLLTGLTGARFAVEVGTFTGYSSLCIARGLAEGGTLLCCDNSEEWTRVAREAWRKAGVEDRITLELASATETIRALPREEHIDFSFIDADLRYHAEYFDELIVRTRRNGVIVIDNTLLRGRVAHRERDEDAEMVHAFNERLLGDDRIESVLLPFHDGVTVVRKVG